MTPPEAVVKFPVLVDKLTLPLFVCSFLLLLFPVYAELPLFFSLGLLGHTIILRISLWKEVLVSLATCILCATMLAFTGDAYIPSERVILQTAGLIVWWATILLAYELFRTEFAIFELSREGISRKMASFVRITTGVNIPPLPECEEEISSNIEIKS